MIAKKSSKADLERKRFAFFQIGLIVAGSLCLAAFEYSSANIEKKVVQIDEDLDRTYTFNEKLHDVEEIQKPEKQPVVQVALMPVNDVTISAKALATTGIFSHSIFGMGDSGYGDLGELQPEDEILDWSDKDPEFPGGDSVMAVFIQTKTIYPELQREMGIQDIVYVEFVVNLDGSISNVGTKNKVNPELEREAIRVIKSMPNWIPGEQAGKAVRVRYVVPINFVIKQN